MIRMTLHKASFWLQEGFHDVYLLFRLLYYLAFISHPIAKPVLAPV